MTFRSLPSSDNCSSWALGSSLKGIWPRKCLGSDLVLNPEEGSVCTGPVQGLPRTAFGVLLSLRWLYTSTWWLCPVSPAVLRLYSPPPSTQLEGNSFLAFPCPRPQSSHEAPVLLNIRFGTTVSSRGPPPGQASHFLSWCLRAPFPPTLTCPGVWEPQPNAMLAL